MDATIAELIVLAVIAVTLVILVSASISDWKDREVSDAHWAVLGAVGAVGFTACCIIWNGLKWEYICLLFGTLMILADILMDSDRYLVLFYILMAVLFIVPLYELHGASDPYFAAWLSIPISYIIFAGMYMFGVIQGGADTKCLICLAISFPVYPQAFSLPFLIGVGNELVVDIFTFAISALFFGAIIVMFVTVYYLITNIKRGTKGKNMAIGRRMSVSEARTSHVWPMEDIVDGKLERCNIPEEPEEVYDRLDQAGVTEIWVTPMIPFIIPITVVVMILIFIGDPLYLI